MSSHVIEEILQVEQDAVSIVEEAKRKASAEMQDLQKVLERSFQEQTILLRKKREQELEEMVSDGETEMTAYREEVASSRITSDEITRRAEVIGEKMSKILLTSQLDDRES